jgi:hypothetical protein
MKCPKCESENTQRLEVVLHGGTQNINTTSASVGGVMRGGAFGALTKTSGQSQSVLAQKATPPAKKKYGFALAMIIMGTLFVGNSLWIGLLPLAIGLFVGYTALQFNSKQWPSLYKTWLDSWLCHKCGTIYHQA